MTHVPLKLPRLYAIVDAGCFAGGNNSGSVASLGSSDRLLLTLSKFASDLASAGVTLLQYRNKFGTAREILSHARELKRVLPPEVTLFLNDRADLCLAAGFHGVHVGQDDLSPEGARLVVGKDRFVGVSTHNIVQLELADQSPVDYIAIGPIFATRTKANPDPVVGLEGLNAVRKLTKKPLVAIGGITRENCRSVIDAGADSVAVIADLLDDPRRRAQEFLERLG
jgi:thiamine-phosphate pyrophosphorylase